MKIFGIILLLCGFIGMFLAKPLSKKLRPNLAEKELLSFEIVIRLVLLGLSVTGSLITILNL